MIQLQNVCPTPLIENGLNPTSQIFNTDGTSRNSREGSFVFDKNYLVTAPSGKGKSTLIHLIYGLRNDYVGNILIDNKNVKTLNVDDWANIRQKKLAIIFQDLRLFLNLTGRENIVLKMQLNATLKNGKKFDYEHAAKRLGVFDFLDQKCETMSYGQRQRIAILRGLAQPFDMILLDEPFSHLDTENIKIASELIRESCDMNKAGFIHVSLGDEYYFNYDEKLVL